jgi:DNA-binding transcriptional regulator YhcF (GntR family)
MKKTNDLYGIKLERENGSSLTEQIYGIFRREIINGRWGVGERMPSFNVMFASTRVSRYPLQTALNRLEKEGFIEKIKQKGIFVKSTYPEGAVLGHIGIVVEENYPISNNPERAVTQAFGIWNLTSLQNFIAKLGFRTEVHVIKPTSGGYRHSFHPDFAFGHKIDGIISLVPESALKSLNFENNIPSVVYLGIEDPLSVPCVTGDPYTAMYKLTNELIATGHREIAVFAPGNWNEYCLHHALDGHIRALTEAGLKYNQESVEISKTVKSNDMLGIKNFLNKNKSATAILSMKVDISHKIVEYADLVGIRIPEDLSLASLQVGNLRNKDGAGGITGAYYDWDIIMRNCTDILFGKFPYNIESVSKILHTPIIEKGITVAVPRAGQ